MVRNFENKRTFIGMMCGAFFLSIAIGLIISICFNNPTKAHANPQTVTSNRESAFIPVPTNIAPTYIKKILNPSNVPFELAIGESMNLKETGNIYIEIKKCVSKNNLDNIIKKSYDKIEVSWMNPHLEVLETRTMYFNQRKILFSKEEVSLYKEDIEMEIKFYKKDSDDFDVVNIILTKDEI